MPWEKNTPSLVNKAFGAGFEPGEQPWTTISGKQVDPDEGVVDEKDMINPLFVGFRDNTKLPSNLKPDPLKQSDKTNKYKCSDGTLVTQSQINRKYAETCKQIDQTRPAVCQGSGRSDVPLSHSHTIPRARCKELGKTELIWDPDNIELEGYEEPTSKPTMAHNIWETGSVLQKYHLLNFQRKLSYIKIHDPQTYQKIVFDLVCTGIT